MIKILPIIRLELYNKESTFLLPNNLLNEVIIILKNHFKYQFKILTCISGVDYPEKLYRFQIVYELLKKIYSESKKSLNSITLESLMLMVEKEESDSEFKIISSKTINTFNSEMLSKTGSNKIDLTLLEEIFNSK